MQRSRLPTVKQLRYFEALERHGHFGQAAAACHVSQSAFSIAIRDLETLLGAQLVERSRRQVTVTPLGREIAEQARLCLRDLELLVELAEQRRRPLTGPLTLGVIPTIAPFLLPRVLPRLRERYPELRLFIREDRTAALCERLAGGELDLVLIAMPYPVRNLTVMDIARDRFLLACREDTTLVDPERFRPSRANAGSILLLEEGHCLREHALAACSLRNLEPINRFAASSLFTLLEMVDADLGVTFLPEMAVGSALLEQTRIRTWPLDPPSHREIALAWRRDSDREAEFRAIGALISEATARPRPAAVPRRRGSRARAGPSRGTARS